MLKAIGVGFGRTGTHSLAYALGKLGLGPCYTILEVDKNPGHSLTWTRAIDGEAVDWQALFSGYQSAVEWPTVSFLPQLWPHFPEAKAILTLRDPESWYESAAATIFPGLEATAQHPDPEIRAISGLKRQLILERTFSGRYLDKEYAIEVYQDHIGAVQELLPSDRLLLYRIADGWRPLCEFMGLPEPDEPFPRRNERADMLAEAPEWAREVMKENRAMRKGT